MELLHRLSPPLLRPCERRPRRLLAADSDQRGKTFGHRRQVAAECPLQGSDHIFRPLQVTGRDKLADLYDERSQERRGVDVPERLSPALEPINFHRSRRRDHFP